MCGYSDVEQRLQELNQQGFQLFQDKLYPQALAILGQVVALSREHFGDDARETGLALLNRGRIYRLLEHNPECEADYRLALDVLRRSRKPSRDEIVWLLKNLSALYKNTGRRAEAEPYERELAALQGTPEAPSPARASVPPPSAPAIDRFQECIRAFVARDYVAAGNQAMALLGAGTMMHGLLQILLISLQRSGQATVLAQVAEQVPGITSEVPWERALLELTLGQADPNVVLAQAENDAQRGQVFFYAAARSITLGKPETVDDLVRRALELLPHSIERILAAEELAARTPVDSRVTDLNTRKELAGAIAARGDIDAAAVLYRQVLADEKAAGLHRTAEWADMAIIQARLCRANKDLETAEALLRDAVEVSREVVGEHEAVTLEALEHLVLTLIDRRRFSDAEAYGAELAEGRRLTVGEQPAFAGALEYMALIAAGRGHPSRAETLWKQALAVYEQDPERHAAQLASVLNHLGAVSRSTGRLIEASARFQRALDVAQKSAPDDERLIAGAMGNLALVLHDQGNLGDSEALYRDVLRRLVSRFGDEALDVAIVRNNLAMLLKSSGKFTEAEALARQALETNRRQRGNRDPETVTCVANLGLLYYEMALYDRAEPLYREALEARQEMQAVNPIELGESLQNLGELYRVTGRLDAAEVLLNQALAVWRGAEGERHPHIATALNNLALLSMAQRNWSRAQELYREAIDFRRQLLGDRHPDLATSMDTLAGLYRATGRPAEARPLCEQALNMRLAQLGESQPAVAWSLNTLALIAAAAGRDDDALGFLSRSSAVDDRLIGQVFAVGSEAQRLQFLNHLRDRQEIFVTLVMTRFADRQEAVNKALDLVLRRKGLVAEALAVQRGAILVGDDSSLKSALETLARLRRDLGAKTMAGPARGESPAEHARTLARWQSEREQLEERIARDVPRMGWEEQLRQTDAAAVSAALPAGSALVEFVRLAVRDFTAVRSRGQSEWLPARYLAFVLHAGNPDAIAFLDLGDAEALDTLIDALRASITGDRAAAPRHNPPAHAGLELRRRLFDPLLTALGSCTHVLLSPDGDLARLPMEVLPTEDGRRLIDDYSFSYVSSGRDVLRLDAPLRGTIGPPIVAADPDFDLTDESAVPGPTLGRRSRDLDRGRGAPRLPGTREEGETIAGMLGVHALLGADVVEARFRDLHSPSIVHLATHGFFVKNQTGFRAAPGLEPPVVENPMLRSGLLLAGFNAWLSRRPVPPEAEDGMLNGEDVSGLDLSDTELAVLSACETGLGEIRAGEGVFGLRRAFVLAGARTLVMSLWKVPDQQTQELMVDFYHRVLSGQPRAEALRQAQLSIKARHPEPVNWAAFICQGSPGPLRLQHGAQAARA